MRARARIFQIAAELAREMAAALRSILLMALALELLLVAAMFPYRSDAPEPIELQPAAPDQKLYDQSYAEGKKESDYVQLARSTAQTAGLEESVRDFVRDNHLEAAHVLEVGAGSGLLQDLVPDYTGLDISRTAHRYFHKPFVQGDARDLPFRDGEFDAAWSIWVFEHVRNPEMGLAELRRVIKPGGHLFLLPAWRVSPFAAGGYHVRPASDFGWKGKMVKTSVLLRESPAFVAAYTLPVRTLRWAWYAAAGRPTSFHYWLLTPNYDHYWEVDSDAVNYLDRYEAYLWFKSRGDVCLNCGSELDAFLANRGVLILRIKPGNAR